MDETPIPPTPPSEPGSSAPTMPPPPPTAPPPTAPAPAIGWGLVRSRRGLLGGVCEGLAVASGVDVVWIRLITVAAAFTGIGVLTYLALWLLVPTERAGTGQVARPAPPDARRWLRIGLVATAIIAVSNLFGGMWLFRADDDPGGFFVGLTLLAVGAVLLWRRRRTAGVAGPYVPTEPWTPWTPDGGAGGPMITSTAAATSTGTAAWTTDVAVPATNAAVPWWARRSNGDIGTPPHRARHLVARVLAWLLVLGSAVVSVSVVVAVSIGALRIWAPGLWATLVVLALVGAAIAATVAPLRVVGVSVIVLVAVGIASLAALRFDGGVGERVVRPTSALEVPDRYRLGIGHLVVDLSTIDVTQLPLRLAIEQGIGRLEVIVPDGITVDLSTRVSAGESIVLGRSDDGTSIRRRVIDPPPATGTGSVSDTAATLDIRLGFGQLIVCRVSGSLVDGAHRECVGD